MAKTCSLIMLSYGLLAVILVALSENVVATAISTRSRPAAPVRVTAFMQPPFISHASETDSDSNYEGFCVDLLQRILVERLNLSFSIEPAGAHGRQQVASSGVVTSRHVKDRNADKQWTGVIGALINKDADIGTGDLRVTPERARVIDYTVPILTGHLVAVAPRNPQRHARVWATIRSMTDFAKQDAIDYGTIRGGSTAKTFENSSHAAYQDMWHHMNSKQGTSFVRNATEGIRRVLQGAGDYAFIMESMAAAYEVNMRPCDLRIIEPDVDDSSSTEFLYAMATQKGSPLLKLLNRELRKLKKTGYVEERFKHWWGQDKAEQDHQKRCPRARRV